MALARDVNKYVDEKAPWFSIKTDRARTATTLYVALRAIDSLKVLFAPFLPFTCQRLHAMLGYSGDLFGKQIVNEYQEATRAHLGLTYDRSRSSTCAGSPAQSADRAEVRRGRAALQETGREDRRRRTRETGQVTHLRTETRSPGVSVRLFSAERG